MFERSTHTQQYTPAVSRYLPTSPNVYDPPKLLTLYSRTTTHPQLIDLAILKLYLADAMREQSGVWPFVMNVSWNPSPYVPPPPYVWEVPVWWWVLGGIFLAAGLYYTYKYCYRFWITQGRAKAIKIRVRDWFYDNCFETCRCLLVKRVHYSTYIMNVYDDGDGVGVVKELFEKLRINEKRKMAWFKVWEKIDVDMSRTMEYDGLPRPTHYHPSPLSPHHHPPSPSTATHHPPSPTDPPPHQPISPPPTNHY